MVRWRQILTIVLMTFFLSIVFNLGSSSLLRIVPLVFSFGLLFFIVLIGIVFDIVGVAAAAGKESPFHAMAANRIPGAKQGIWMLRNADRVATFASDVVGDIAGTLSGAIGAAIVFRLLLTQPGWNETALTTLTIAVVAAVTVGGKAWGKTIAISRCTEILYIAGRVLYMLEPFGLRLEKSNHGRNRPVTRRRM